MNAEALIGTVLGTCTLQKLVGQGGMGAVFLAQQSRPKRQVAVKVLLPMKSLTPNQLAAFLERFRRETDAAASLEHPNIIPVHEYGEREGLAYLVMPYVSGGTLRDELERCGPLPLENVACYLEQIAAAIDFAHEHGVIHRDIKPANIMVTPEGRLLLVDFGLVKIVADGQTPQVRITGVGAPVGTPDYMSPEQVIGGDVDTRADLYSLGVVLYQMVTGTTPFRGETPMQIAAQHLQIPPPSAQMMRPDLPMEAEQVLQRALAKRPADRYRSARDLADAFRVALVRSGIQLDASYGTNGLLTGSTTGRLAIPKGQFDPMRQTASIPKVSKPAPALHNTDRQPTIRGVAEALPAPALSLDSLRLSDGPLSRAGKLPVERTSTYCSVQPDEFQKQSGGGLLSRTGKFPMVGTGTVSTVQPSTLQVQRGALSSDTGKRMASTRDLPPSRMTDVVAAEFAPPSQDAIRSRAGTRSTVGNLLGQGTQVVQELTDIVEPYSPMEVAEIPVVEQSGQFVKGLHPLAPTGASPVATSLKGVSLKGREQAPSVLDPMRKLTLTPRMKIALLIAAVILVAIGLVGFLWFTHNTPTPSQGTAAVVTLKSIDGTNKEGFHGRRSINW
jgi:serine/threonine protein kinase